MPSQTVNVTGDESNLGMGRIEACDVVDIARTYRSRNASMIYIGLPRLRLIELAKRLGEE